MRISGNGKVGIGITEPKEKLHTKGTLYLTDSDLDAGIKIIPQKSEAGGNSGGRIFFKEECRTGVNPTADPPDNYYPNGYGFSLGYNGGHGDTHRILNWPDNTFCISNHQKNDTGAVALSIKKGPVVM